jgi:hypothetical protein
MARGPELHPGGGGGGINDMLMTAARSPNSFRWMGCLEWRGDWRRMNQKFDLQVALENKTSGKRVRLHVILFRDERKFKTLKRSGAEWWRRYNRCTITFCLGILYIRCKSCDELLMDIDSFIFNPGSVAYRLIAHGT